MTYKGTVRNGVVVLPPELNLPEGSAVEISPAQADGGENSFSLMLSQFAKHGDLPDDFAANHDYYIHGDNHKQQPRQGRWIVDTQSSAELTDQQAAHEANKFASMAAETIGLPPDLSTNHDHYLHVLPKR